MTQRVIGVISDTHGLVREEVKSELASVDLIIHAGDIGKPEVIETLQAIAPLIIIKGNIDRGAWAQDLPETQSVEIDGYRIHVIHNLKELNIDPADRYSVIVSGHSHIPKYATSGDVIYFNPGSVGPRRFHLPISMGKLHISEQGIEGELIHLNLHGLWVPLR